MNKKIDRSWWIIIIVLFGAIIFAICMKSLGNANAQQSVLFQLADQLTKGYQIKQIIASTLMFMVGRLFVERLLSEWDEKWKVVLAVPVANATWGVLGAVMLFVGIPYNRISTGIVFGAIIIFILAQIRDRISCSCVKSFAKESIVAASVSIVVSTGILPIFMSSDSYYYVMQYGELIAKEQTLNMDTVGMFMTWTGVTPALISSFAVFGGFETIHVIHYMLIMSMVLGVALATWEQVRKKYSFRKSIIAVLAVTLMLVMIPAFTLLASWIISNSYFMVYMFFLVYLPTKNDKDNLGIWIILALFCAWMAMSRAESSLDVWFLIVCLGCLKVSKKRLLQISIPAVMCVTLFFLRIILETKYSQYQATEKMLTVSNMAVMSAAMLLLMLYLLLYDTEIIKVINRYLSQLILGGLLVVCIVLGALQWERFINNISAAFYNLQYEYWGYFPWVTLLIGVLFIRAKKINYWDTVIAGYILFNFVICMCRPHYLRLGFGDSYNRILIGIIPVILISLVVKTLEIMDAEGEDVYD